MRIQKEIIGFWIGGLLLLLWSVYLLYVEAIETGKTCYQTWQGICISDFADRNQLYFFALPALLIVQRLTDFVAGSGIVAIQALLMVAYHFFIGGMIGKLFAKYMLTSQSIELEKGKTIELFTIYALVSWASFMSTTSGWVGFLFVLPFYALSFILLWIIFLVVNLIHKKPLNISVQKMHLLLGVQIGATFFNIGDGGDSYGTVVFMQRLFGSTETFDPLIWLGGVFIVTYFITLFFTLFPNTIKFFKRMP